jgi:hypothetical protein
VISTILTVSRIDDPATGERLFSSQMQDVTARNEALTALSNSERRLRAIVEHSSIGERSCRTTAGVYGAPGQTPAKDMTESPTRQRG